MPFAPTPQARHLVLMSIGLFLFHLRNTFQLGDRSYCLQNWDFLCSVSLRLQTTFRRSSAEKTRTGIPNNVERRNCPLRKRPTLKCWVLGRINSAYSTQAQVFSSFKGAVVHILPSPRLAALHAVRAGFTSTLSRLHAECGPIGSQLKPSPLKG